MSTLWAALLGLALLLVVAASAIAVRAFVRATSGAQGLKARIARLFLLPVRERRLPPGHYFKAYWREQGKP
jgi:hypothetical protein